MHADIIQSGQKVQSVPSPTKLSSSKVQEDKQLAKRCCICIPCFRCSPGFLNNILIKFQQERHEEKLASTLILVENLKQNTCILDTTQRKYSMQGIISQRRLILVLDLDNTLLHASPSYNRQVSDLIRNSRKESSDLFVVNKLALVTKLRPHARAFLEALHPMYDLYVYTMRNRTYAATMTRLLDPEGRFIGSKVISCEDSTTKGTKALDVLSSPPEAVVIIDDTMEVWRRTEDQEHVINIKRYYYSGFCRAGSSKKEEDTGLLNAFTVLKRIHSEFFSLYPDNDQQQPHQKLRDELNITDNHNNDVCVLLRNIQGKILRGCCIVFSGIFSMELKAEMQAVWILAQRLGSSCSTELDVNKVTHVIARSQCTQEAHWAAANDKFLVTPEWLDEAFYSWTKPPEGRFSVHAISNASVLKRGIYLL